MQRSIRWLRNVVLMASVAGASPSIVRAQSLGELPAGQRVRFVLVDSLRQGPIFPARQEVVGQLVRVTADSVWLRPHGASEFSVARQHIKQARASRGVSRLRSALAMGLSIGVTTAFAVDRSRGSDSEHRTRDAWLAGGIGFSGGALIGALSPYEHWRRLRK